jgi:FKBP-type peptidyl-prolyl cis-trans isomerase FkpA
MRADEPFKNNLLQMKQTTFTLLLFCVLGLVSCRKDKIELNIKQYDNQQILNYIKVHGLTNMVRDTAGGDTSGIYYEILSVGNKAHKLTSPSLISLVYTLRTLDGVYQSNDTINNHFYDYIGHIATDNLPLGLQTALLNDLQYSGGRMRVLIPSHLAYGVNGTGSGSSQVANNRITGNECLDYYINVVDNQADYDDVVIQNFMKNNGYTGYNKIQTITSTITGKDTSYTYYKVLTAPTGTDIIDASKTITFTATGSLLNGIVFNNQNIAGVTNSADVDNLYVGIQQALIAANASVGTKISILIPSFLGLGTTSSTGADATGASVTIPSNSCMRFTFIIDTVTP